MINTILLTITLLFTSLCTISEAQTLENTLFITEDLPPYNYLEDGELKGASVQILLEALQATGITKTAEQISVYPWARGFKTTLMTPNTCLFSTVRSKTREKQFKWVGPIADVNLVFVSLKGTIKINDLTDLNKYSVTTIKKGIGHQLLLEHGVPEKIIDLSPTAASMVEKIKRGRVDLLLENENVLYHVLQQKGLDWSNFEINYVLNLGEIYYAFNLETDDSVVNRLQRGIDAIRSQGRITEIVGKLPIDKD